MRTYARRSLPTATDNSAIATIAVFIALTILLSTPMWLLARKSGFYTVFQMWCPALAAVATLKITGGSLSELGWHGTNLKWIALSWVVVIIGWIAAYGAVCYLGFAGFPNKAELSRITKDSLLLNDAPTPIAVLVLVDMPQRRVSSTALAGR